MEGFIASVLIVCIFAFGHIVALQSVSEDCNKLGKFYFGKTIYDCKVKRVQNGENNE